jgi:hypothetical protein
MAQNTQLAQDMNEGSSFFGKIVALLLVVVFGLIGLFFIICSLYLIIVRSRFTEKAEATVTEVTCSNVPSTPPTSKLPLLNKSPSHCHVTLKYALKDTVITAYIETPLTVTKGQKIIIYYNPNNPQNVSLSSTKPFAVGIILFCVGLLTIAGAGVYYFIINGSSKNINNS